MSSVAGLRSGGGPLDCESPWAFLDALLTLAQIVQVRLRECENMWHGLFDNSLLMFQTRVNNLAQAAPWQLQKTNVRVNSICPGLIETAMTAKAFEHARKKGIEHKVGQLNPTARYAVAQGNCSLWAKGPCMFLTELYRGCKHSTLPGVRYFL